MPVFSALSQTLEALARGASSMLDLASLDQLLPPEDRTGQEDWAKTYAYRWAYYLGFGIYDDIARLNFETDHWGRAIQNLRNPAREVVEFYVAHTWPGPLETALPLEAKSPEHVAAIQQVWQWSNWASQKNPWVRKTAGMGDGFLQAASPPGRKRVYIHVVSPPSVTDFDVDERGFVTFIRLTDRVVSQRTGKEVIRTEVWQKGTAQKEGTHRIWESLKREEQLSKLGEPLETHPLSEYGIDYVPFVWTPFVDIGEKRGMNAYFGVKDEIDELNAMVTRLHQLLFIYGKPDKAILAGGFAPDGTPLVPPELTNRDGSSTAGNVVTIGDEDLYYFPGASRMEFMVAPINWDAHLKAIEAQTESLRQKLPEITYYQLQDRELSGRAIRTLLGPAIKRVEEVRGNLEQALIRVQMMCLTQGIAQDLFPQTLGSFAKGDFAHSFKPREVIPLSQEEQADTEKVEAETGLLLSQLGVSQATILERLGFDPLKEARLREVTAADLAERELAAFEKGQ